MWGLCEFVYIQVQDLRYATLATVSRCGMVWFSEDVLSTEMIFENYLARLRYLPVEEGEEESRSRIRGPSSDEEELSPALQARMNTFFIVLCELFKKFCS